MPANTGRSGGTRWAAGGICLGVLRPAAGAAQAVAQETEFYRAATRALAHGDHDAARVLASERPASDPAAAALLARLDILSGDYDAAEARLTPVAEANPVRRAAP